MTPLLVLAVHSAFLLCAASETPAFPKLDQRNLEENRYDCGNVFFSDKLVKDSLAMASTEETSPILSPYTGPLYSDEMGYMTMSLFPKKSHLRKSSASLRALLSQGVYRAVFDKEDTIIDVIVKTTNGEFAKCWKKGSSLPEYNMEGSNGYQCGHKLIADETIQKYVIIARSYMDKNLFYPSQYHGHLYPGIPGLMIWPIDIGTNSFQSPKWNSGSIFILLDGMGQLKDVLIRTVSRNFLQCMRSKITPTSSPSTNLNNRVVQYYRSGYMCNGLFFDNVDLQRAARLAKESNTNHPWKTYPRQYNGAPINSACLLWPVTISGRSHFKGKMGPYRLVLTPNFEIMTLAMKSQSGMKLCDRRTYAGKKFQDEHDFQCGRMVFTHQDLIETAEIACKKMRLTKSSYPARYEGPDFDVVGPYLTFPLLKAKFYTHNTGLHRLVMNTSCKVAGALTKLHNTADLKKCRILNGNQHQSPDEGINEQPIVEHLRVFRNKVDDI